MSSTSIQTLNEIIKLLETTMERKQSYLSSISQDKMKDGVIKISHHLSISLQELDKILDDLELVQQQLQKESKQ